MAILELCVNSGIGDSLAPRILFDSIKDRYDEIRVCHSKQVFQHFRENNPKYLDFLNELGELLFTQKPFVFDHVDRQPTNHVQMYATLVQEKCVAVRPNLDYLCSGEPLQTDRPYIVITTKVREIIDKFFYPLAPQFYQTVNKLTDKYQIVLMGEREIERNREYSLPIRMHDIFSIYQPLINSLKDKKIIDLTVPALGITVPDMTKIRQDMLIMKNAKAVINFGIGGNLWLSAAVANTIGFRNDHWFPTAQLTDMICNPQFPSVFLTKDWSEFIAKLDNL